jgi:hypothetical protein
MKFVANKAVVFIAILLVVLSNATGAMGLDKSLVTFSSTAIENEFPKSLKFSVSVNSDSIIESAKFFYYFRNDSTTTMEVLEMEPSRQVDLTYKFNTYLTDAIPSSPIFYYWQVKLDSGESIKSTEELVYYDDIRYDWHVREQGNMAVWWHDRPQEFGETVFGIAEEAMREQRKLFGIELEFPIRLIIYNTDEEFAEWHYASTEYVGGQAFPTLGITTQIVEDVYWQEEWLMEVVPHEISHLYFFQVTYNPLVEAPTWLDEGVAQLTEFGDTTDSLRAARNAIRSGNYLPLWSLSGSFDDTDADRFSQAYDESISAVTYLVDIYGEDALTLLFAEYKQGHPTGKAFPNAIGVSFEEFEQGWLEWLDAPAGTYIPPVEITPLPMGARPTRTPPPTVDASATLVNTPVSVAPSSSESTMNNLYLLGIMLFCIACLCWSVPLITAAIGIAIFKGNKQ